MSIIPAVVLTMYTYNLINYICIIYNIVYKNGNYYHWIPTIVMELISNKL